MREGKRCLTPLLNAPEGDALEEDILALAAQRSEMNEMRQRIRS